jgi:hypothetical protein
MSIAQRIVTLYHQPRSTNSDAVMIAHKAFPRHSVADGIRCPQKIIGQSFISPPDQLNASASLFKNCLLPTESPQKFQRIPYKSGASPLIFNAPI